MLIRHRHPHLNVLWIRAAGGHPGRWNRPVRHLLRRRPGRVHPGTGHPVQHHRSRPGGGSGWCGSRTSAIGCAVSLLVGLLFWPRGARAALRQALAEAYTDSAEYLSGAVDFGLSRCDGNNPPLTSTAPINNTANASRAAAASRRLDDAFRSYLAERGPKPIPLAQATSLVTGVAGLRLAADAVMDLWQRDDGVNVGDRAAARRELLTASGLVKDWYEELAASLLDEQHALPDPLAHDKVADGRLVDAVRHDLRGVDGNASATAVRMIWTGDHLDAVRRLQASVIGPARAASAARSLGALSALRGFSLRH